MSPNRQREERVQQTARDIFAAMRPARHPLLSAERWQGEMMEWAMADELLKVEMLRFVDVFPTLRSRREIGRHLREYFARQGVATPTVLRWGVNLAAQRSPVAPVASAVIRRQMKGFAQRFIVGRDARSAIPALKALRDQGMGFTLDVLGEATVSEAEAHAYQRIYLDLLDGLAAQAAGWGGVPVIDDSAWGALPRVNLSLKITSLYSQLDPVDFEGCVAAVKDRLRPIFRKAIETGAALTLDLEQFRYRDLTLRVFTSLLDEDEFRGYEEAGVVLQAYLRDADGDLSRLISWAEERGRVFNLRLVKGAYWDYETVLAAQEGWPVPVFTHKPDTDAMFERLTQVMLEHPRQVRPAFASHNVRSLAHAIVCARELGLPDAAYEIQMLHGMGEPIKQAIRGMGLRLREYAPVGELIPGMAYLVRRLLENTANDSFLRQTFVEGAAVEELIQPPRTSPDLGAPVTRRPVIRPTDAADPGPFANQPHADFSRAENRDDFDAALRAVRSRAGKHHPLRIGGRDIDTARRLESVNPAAPAEVLGTVAYGGRAEAEAAVAAAQAAAPGWRDAEPRDRAAVLFRAAELMRGEAVELAALMMLESGKTRREAGADVDEAVDFLRVLRSRDAATVETATHGACPRRAQRLLLSAARGGAGDRAVELPARDPHRDDQRGPRGRRPGHHEAGRPHAAHRGAAGAPPAKRPARRRASSTSCRRRGRGRRLPRPPPRRRPHRVHRLDGRGSAHHQPGGAASGARRRQARHRRDGRQERHHRRRRRGPGRGRRRGRRLRLRLRRPEVLGRLARDRPGIGLRRLRAPACSRPREASRSGRRRTRQCASGPSSAPTPGQGSRTTSSEADARRDWRPPWSRPRAAGRTAATSSRPTSSSTSRPAPRSPRRRSSALWSRS